MLSLLRPDLYLDSVYDLDWCKLRARGITALILDLDNTLVAWRASEMSERLRAWVREMKRHGLSPCMVSNNLAERVGLFAGELGMPFIPSAVKPRRSAFRRAMKLLGSQPGETAVIGDQVFTDVLGGNRLGLFTVLVVPITRNEFVGTRLVRVVERWVLRSLALSTADGS